jgi:hypothetical protein
MLVEFLVVYIEAQALCSLQEQPNRWELGPYLSIPGT